MRLITYHAKSDNGVGVMLDDTRFVALPRHAPGLPHSMKTLLGMGEEGLRKAEAAAKGKRPSSSRSAMTFSWSLTRGGITSPAP